MKIGEMKNGRPTWIGVDFDGTISEHESGASLSILGPPIPAMIKRVKFWLSLGWTVKIVTARVSTSYPHAEVYTQRQLVSDWTFEHVGRRLEVVSEKDGEMVELWDDRAVRVERNSARRVSQCSVDPGDEETRSVLKMMTRDVALKAWIESAQSTNPPQRDRFLETITKSFEEWFAKV